MGLRPIAFACLLLLAEHARAQQEMDTPPPLDRTQALPASTKEPVQDVTLPEVSITETTPGLRLYKQPIAVQTTGMQELADRQIDSLEQVLRGTPGVSMNSSGGMIDNNVYIRGVGSLYQSSSDDLIYGLSIDGVQVPSRYLTLGTLDIERIDVHKGPQGTDTSASGAGGLIAVQTQRPTSQLEGYARAEMGQHGRNLQEAAIGGALGDQVSARVAVRHAGEDLWVTNSQSGSPVAKPDDLAVRGSLAVELTSRTTLEFSASHQKIKESPNLLVLRPYGSHPQLSLPPGTYAANEQAMGLYTARISHDFDNSRFSATTGYTDMDFTRVLPYDENLYEALYGARHTYAQTYQGREHMFSQDLRWSSLPSAPVQWTVGAYFSDGQRSNNALSAPGGSTMQAREYSTRRQALFGDVSYPITSSLKVNAGLRHEWLRRDYDAIYRGSSGDTTDARQLRDNYTTGRLGLSYEWTPQTMVYGSFARGHNPASFQDYAGQAADSAPYKAAQVDTLELGFKTRSADKRWELNGAIYHNDVKNNQTMVYNPRTYVSSIVNVDTRSRGAELGGAWRASSALTLTAAVAYTDPKIASNLDTAVGPIANGNRLPDVSKWSATLGARYQQALPGFLGLSAPLLKAQANYAFVGRRSVDPQNHFDLAGYGKLDLRIGIQQGKGELYVWADNVLNKQYDLYGYWGSQTVTYGAPSRGRMVGVGFRYLL